MELHRYNCRECEVPTWVDWKSRSNSTNPCCANCGEEKNMKFVETMEVIEGGEKNEKTGI